MPGIVYESGTIKNIKFSIMYDGSSYSGWQRVNNVKATKPSLQGLIEQTLSVILEEPIKIHASGRTDAGVHAIGQVVNFLSNNIKDVNTIQRKLNEALPEDIQVYSMNEVPKKFHSRYDTKHKTYEYHIDTRERESVFTRKYAYPLGEALHIDVMKEAAVSLVGTHDFKAFCTDRRDGKSTCRTIYNLLITEENVFSNKKIIIKITADGFLYNMVRIIVGTLIEIGLLKRSPESIKIALNSKERSDAGAMIGSQGLFLKNVDY